MLYNNISDFFRSSSNSRVRSSIICSRSFVERSSFFIIASTMFKFLQEIITQKYCFELRALLSHVNSSHSYALCTGSRKPVINNALVIICFIYYSTLVSNVINE